MTDLMNVFYELDVDHTGVVCLADFERLMLQLSFGPDAALRLFQRLDTDGDGALSLSDWTSEDSKTLAEMLCFRIIRQRIVGRNPVKAQMPTPSVSPAWTHRTEASLKLNSCMPAGISALLWAPQRNVPGACSSPRNAMLCTAAHGSEDCHGDDVGRTGRECQDEFGESEVPLRPN